MVRQFTTEAQARLLSPGAGIWAVVDVDICIWKSWWLRHASFVLEGAIVEHRVSRRMNHGQNTFLASSCRCCRASLVNDKTQQDLAASSLAR